MGAAQTRNSNKNAETSPLLLSGQQATSVYDDTLSSTREEKEKSLWSNDIYDTIKLAVPIFFSRLSWVGMRTTDTALLGHVSAEALSASALSDLWTSSSGILIQGSVLGILVGQAVGADNPKLAGIYLQVSFCVLSCMAVVVIVVWSFTEEFWLAFGESPELAKDAGYFANVLAFGIPGRIIFSQLSQYFSAQRIMHPEVVTSTTALSLNLAFGLIFVFGIPFPNFDGFGFAACPIVTAVVIYLQILVFWYFFLFRQRLHEPSWGGFAPHEITWERIRTFSSLYFPAAFSLASDFWRVFAVGAIAARLGETEVGVFNTSYRIMWIALVIVGSISGASGVRTSLCLGNGDHEGAKQAAYVGIAVALGFLVLTCTLMLLPRGVWLLGSVFTPDPAFLSLLDDCSLPFTSTLFFMCLAVVLERIPYSMGRTYDVFVSGLVASWGAQVPAVFLLTKYWRNDLVALYTGVCIGYVVLVILYGAMVLRSDWKTYADLARQRAEK
mmetsp:Transcript_7185/g.10500  ORF Transcript_7185/g.10500 Transcript_7185/m.10500 type:complete len:498 (+) Transcript_7185:180-1673(+)|eukprot:CAMPEP_0194219226 /NCGR_PEP_ID=MMETSP0156-20130528/25429_1 /TAXON_ID=33649 /ORGANISM="Thalassionema nitzschioides, Strain L26-B" /LENGTH=497 /DNA_ID=CAMNT_0038948803 /DNA_START=139 /DNA_END=1632 /DNA_ORIENTATION=+